MTRLGDLSIVLRNSLAKNTSLLSREKSATSLDRFTITIHPGEYIPDPQLHPSMGCSKTPDMSLEDILFTEHPRALLPGSVYKSCLVELVRKYAISYRLLCEILLEKQPSLRYTLECLEGDLEVSSEQAETRFEAQRCLTWDMLSDTDTCAFNTFLVSEFQNLVSTHIQRDWVRTSDVRHHIRLLCTVACGVWTHGSQAQAQETLGPFVQSLYDQVMDTVEEHYGELERVDFVHLDEAFDAQKWRYFEIQLERRKTFCTYSGILRYSYFQIFIFRYSDIQIFTFKYSDSISLSSDIHIGSPNSLRQPADENTLTSFITLRSSERRAHALYLMSLSLDPKSVIECLVEVAQLHAGCKSFIHRFLIYHQREHKYTRRHLMDDLVRHHLDGKIELKWQGPTLVSEVRLLIRQHIAKLLKFDKLAGLDVVGDLGLLIKAFVLQDPQDPCEEVRAVMSWLKHMTDGSLERRRDLALSLSRERREELVKRLECIFGHPQCQHPCGPRKLNTEPEVEQPPMKKQKQHSDPTYSSYINT